MLSEKIVITKPYVGFRQCCRRLLQNCNMVKIDAYSIHVHDGYAVCRLLQGFIPS